MTVRELKEKISSISAYCDNFSVTFKDDDIGGEEYVMSESYATGKSDLTIFLNRITSNDD